jgi:serine/threonine-protein phosphatase 2A regulatory subunit B'
MNLFRPLPKAPPPSGDPDEEEVVFADPQWPHLSIVYEILLRLVSTEQIDLTLKKKVIDTTLVRQMLSLFDSEETRERDYLKARGHAQSLQGRLGFRFSCPSVQTITHRIYSKLTLRRAPIRRGICNVFLEFIFETEVHNGIAQLLEILARWVLRHSCSDHIWVRSRLCIAAS